MSPAANLRGALTLSAITKLPDRKIMFNQNRNRLHLKEHLGQVLSVLLSFFLSSVKNLLITGMD